MDIYGEPSSNRILVPKGVRLSVRKEFGVRILNLRVLFATLLPQSPGAMKHSESSNMFSCTFFMQGHLVCNTWQKPPLKNLACLSFLNLPVHCRSQKLRQLHSQFQRWQRFQRWRTLTRQGVDVEPVCGMPRGFGWNGWQLIVYTMQIQYILYFYRSRFLDARGRGNQT